MDTLEQQLKTLRQVKPSSYAYEHGRILLLEKLAEHSRIIPQEVVQNRRITVLHRLSELFGTVIAPVMMFARWSLGIVRFVYTTVRFVTANTVISTVVVLVLLLGAGSYFGHVAANAPPYEVLYTVKQTLEKTQLALSFSDTGKAKTEIVLLKRRVAELDQLITQSNSVPSHEDSTVKKALEYAQNQAHDVKQRLSVLAGGDDTERLDVFSEIAEDVGTVTIAASKIESTLPSGIKQEIQPEVDQLTRTLSEINSILEEADQELSLLSAGESAGFISEDIPEGGLGDSFVSQDLGQTSITSTDLVIGIDDLDPNIEQAVQSNFIPVVQDRVITPEDDTFPVSIGD